MGSSGGQMTVQFTSDGSVQAAGFAASYTTGGSSGSAPVLTTPPFMFAPNVQPALAASVPTLASGAVCSGTQTLLSASGIITDGPSTYQPNMQCTWTIMVGRAVTLSFSSFSLESGYDFVKVYDGPVGVGMLGSFSGGTIPTPVTSSAQMTVVFTADSSVQDSGFVATYS